MGKYSNYVGISKHLQSGLWTAIVYKNAKMIHLGYFKTEQEAINARKQKEIELGKAFVVENLEGEVWVKSPTLGDDYMVSNKGRIKSLKYAKGNFEKVLTPTLSRCGRYWMIIKSREHKSHLVHRLIAEGFYGESDLDVNHIDGDGFNNNIENLEYVTNRENISHALGGAKGCHFSFGKWSAEIRVNKKIVHLGTFPTYEEAHQRYKDALIEYGLNNKYVA